MDPGQVSAETRRTCVAIAVTGSLLIIAGVMAEAALYLAYLDPDVTLPEAPPTPANGQAAAAAPAAAPAVAAPAPGAVNAGPPAPARARKPAKQQGPKTPVA